MTKQEFLDQIADRLSTLPEEELSDRLAFYSEMIDDRMDDGLSEEDAVGAVGSINEVTAQILADIPLVKIAKERIKRRKRLHVWETVLLWVGSPIWLSLLIALFSVILSLYLSLLSIVISLWAVFGALIGSGIGCIVGGIYFSCCASIVTGLAVIGVGAVCIGLSVFSFYGCKLLTKGAYLLPKKLAHGLKTCFLKKEDTSC